MTRTINRAASLLYRTRLSSEVWKQACTLVIDDADSSASSLQRALGIGSYRTAWRATGLIRKAMLAVKWPALKGEVEVCDVNISSRGRPLLIWIATERTGTAAKALMRAWSSHGDFRDDFRRIASALSVNCTVITPPSGVYREMKALGLRLRCESIGKADSLPAAAATGGAFCLMLAARHHHGFTVATLDSYLAEFVFRRNAATLGWSCAEQRRRIMARLKAPTLSA